MVTPQQFATQGLTLSQEAGVVDSLHGYFVAHHERLYKTCEVFGLLDQPLGKVLEVGPFYGYTPFLLQSNCTSYSVLEGDDPVVYPLKPLYERRQIQVQYVDLFEWFGPLHSASYSLGYPENSFDTVLCWETMEHFNFNPVKFVRDLQRVLKPGGRAYITVPNKASFQNLQQLLLGRGEDHGIQMYFDFEDYLVNGKKAFHGFHWREYTRPELEQLFGKVGFQVLRSETFMAFQTHARSSWLRRLARLANRAVVGVFSRYATHVLLVVQKGPAKGQSSTAPL